MFLSRKVGLGLVLFALVLTAGAQEDVSSESELKNALRADSPQLVEEVLNKTSFEADKLSQYFNAYVMLQSRQRKSVNVQIAEKLIQSGVNVRYVDKKGNAMIHIAYALGDIEAAHLLLGIGADIETKNKNQEAPTVLLNAIANKKVALVRDILDRGASPAPFSYTFKGETDDPEDMSIRAYSPLLNAAQSGEFEIYKVLLERGADFHATVTVTTPFASNDVYVSIACGNGVNVHYGDDVTQTASFAIVDAIVDAPDSRMLRYSHENNYLTAEDLNQAVFSAADHANLPMLKYLQSIGANINAKPVAKDEDFFSNECPNPLFAFFQISDFGKDFNSPEKDSALYECFKFLIEQGCSVHDRNYFDETILMQEVASNPVWVKRLIQAGADVNVESRLGETPLSKCVGNVAWRGEEAINQAAEAAKLLIQAGADKNHCDSDGKRAYDILNRDYNDDPRMNAKRKAAIEKLRKILE